MLHPYWAMLHPWIESTLHPNFATLRSYWATTTSTLHPPELLYTAAYWAMLHPN